MEATRKYETATDRAATTAHETVDKVAGAAQAAARAVEQRSGQFMDASERYMEQCRESVRASPFASVGIALAAGFVLGYLLVRR